MIDRIQVFAATENFRYYTEHANDGDGWPEAAQEAHRFLLEIRDELVQEGEQLAMLVARSRDFHGWDAERADTCLVLVDEIDAVLPAETDDEQGQQYIAIRRKNGGYWTQRRTMVAGNTAPTANDERVSKSKKYTRVYGMTHMLNIFRKQGKNLPVWRNLGGGRWVQEA